MAYLIDTDWAVWYLRGRPEVVARLREREHAGLAISVVTLAELWEGIEASKDPVARRRGLTDFLRYVEVLPLSNDVAERFGREAARLSQRGETLPDFDVVIAATAIQHDLTLLSEDRHFARIEKLKLESLASG
jgi:tRNA(fMet)-specific endonuclease VapC